MLIRIWRGRVANENLKDYLARLQTTCMSCYRQARGNRGVQILRSQDKEVQVLEVHSFWNSILK